MLNLPIGNDMFAVQARVHKIISVAREDDDRLLLRQLWCLLRNAEAKLPHGVNQGHLHKMRDWVAQEMTNLKIAQDRSSPVANSERSSWNHLTETPRIAMNDEFEAGDVVELMDGSPLMTVGSVADGLALCSWSLDGRAHRHRYPLSALKVVPQGAGDPDAV